jgi:hypothetical protein
MILFVLDFVNAMGYIGVLFGHGVLPRYCSLWSGLVYSTGSQHFCFSGVVSEYLLTAGRKLESEGRFPGFADQEYLRLKLSAEVGAAI